MRFNFTVNVSKTRVSSLNCMYVVHQSVFFFLWQDDGDSVEREKMEIFRHLQEKKQQFEAYEKEKQRAALSLRDQDSDMPDIDHETFPGTKDL